MYGVWRIDGHADTENPKYTHKFLYQHHIFYHKFYMESPVIETRNPQWDAGDLLPEP